MTRRCARIANSNFESELVTRCARLIHLTYGKPRGSRVTLELRMRCARTQSPFGLPRDEFRCGPGRVTRLMPLVL